MSGSPAPDPGDEEVSCDFELDEPELIAAPATEPVAGQGGWSPYQEDILWGRLSGDVTGVGSEGGSTTLVLPGRGRRRLESWAEGGSTGEPARLDHECTSRL